MRNPIRIQRKRIKGWKMPENTIYVGRPSKWGNYFVAGYKGVKDNKQAVALFQKEIDLHKELNGEWIEKIKEELKGKNLACWCKLSEPCHADILLKIANL